MDAIRGAGCEPLLVEDWTEAVGIFFVNRRVRAVVIDCHGRESLALCLAQTLRSLRNQVPVILLSSQIVDPIPPGIDACLCRKKSCDEVLPRLRSLLTAGGASECATRHCA